MVAPFKVKLDRGIQQQRQARLCMYIGKSPAGRPDPAYRQPNLCAAAGTKGSKCANKLSKENKRKEKKRNAGQMLKASWPNNNNNNKIYIVLGLARTQLHLHLARSTLSGLYREMCIARSRHSATQSLWPKRGYGHILPSCHSCSNSFDCIDFRWAWVDIPFGWPNEMS